MKKTKNIEELQFCRRLQAYKGEEKDIYFIAQPYCVGMYVIIDNNPALQLSLSHKGYNKWVKGTIKKMEKNGLKVEVSYEKLLDFLTKEEIESYVLN
jgi:ribosomal protein L21E